MIVRYAGFTILTDPNFLHSGDHVHLGYGITFRRRTDPAIEIEALPAMDFVLLSHYHGDHFDHVIEEKLDKSLPIVTTHHAADGLADKEFHETHPRRNGRRSAYARARSKLRSPRCQVHTHRAYSRRPFHR